MSELNDCKYCGGRNTLIQCGTRVWLGTRYGEPTHWEVNHWCSDGRSTINLKDKTEKGVIAKWNKT